MPFLSPNQQHQRTVTVASAGPYANNLHLAPHRWPYQHPITQFIQAITHFFPAAFNISLVTNSSDSTDSSDSCQSLAANHNNPFTLPVRGTWARWFRGHETQTAVPRQNSRDTAAGLQFHSHAVPCISPAHFTLRFTTTTTTTTRQSQTADSAPGVATWGVGGLVGPDCKK